MSTRRPYYRWTPEQQEQLAELSRQRTPILEIARILGHSKSSIHQQKYKSGLVVRPAVCEHCDGPVQIRSGSRSGRPRRYCGDECARQAKSQRLRQATADRIAAAAALREDKVCENADCSNVVPKTSPKYRFCCRLCQQRTHELTYLRPSKRAKEES